MIVYIFFRIGNSCTNTKLNKTFKERWQNFDYDVSKNQIGIKGNKKKETKCRATFI